MAKRKSLLAATVGVIPFWFLYRLSDLAFFILYRVLGYRTKVVFGNLQKAFPTKSHQELKKIERDFYRHFCDVFIEAAKAYSLSKEQIIKRYKVTNPELTNALLAKGKSAVLYAGHLGNWEWFALLPSQVKHKVLSFYQPLSNHFFDEVMLAIRESNGVECVPSKSGIKTVMQYAQEQVPMLNLMIGDQSPRKTGPKHWTTFMNQETPFLIGAAIVAKKTGQALIFPSIKKVKRGHYELTFEMLEENPLEKPNEALIDAYVKALEKALHESPSIWLWSHRRWKLNRVEHP